MFLRYYHLQELMKKKQKFVDAALCMQKGVCNCAVGLIYSYTEIICFLEIVQLSFTFYRWWSVSLLRGPYLYMPPQLTSFFLPSLSLSFSLPPSLSLSISLYLSLPPSLSLSLSLSLSPFPSISLSCTKNTRGNNLTNLECPQLSAAGLHDWHICDFYRDAGRASFGYKQVRCLTFLVDTIWLKKTPLPSMGFFLGRCKLFKSVHWVSFFFFF